MIQISIKNYLDIKLIRVIHMIITSITFEMVTFI